MHITHDSMVTVLRNKVWKFRFYMYLKEGLYTWTFYAQYLIYFLRLNFLWWRLECRISQKIVPQQKNPIIQYPMLIFIPIWQFLYGFLQCVIEHPGFFWKFFSCSAYWIRRVSLYHNSKPISKPHIEIQWLIYTKHKPHDHWLWP